MKEAYIDVETTGLSAYKNGIIELALIVEIDGIEQFRWASKMNPLPCEVDQKALDVTSITLEEIQTYPHMQAVIGDFVARLDSLVVKWDKKDKLHFTAYNAIFDQDFVRNTMKAFDPRCYFGSYFWWPVTDVMGLAAEFLKEQRPLMVDFKLGTVYEWLFDEKLEDAHEAMADIKATRRIHKHITQHGIRRDNADSS